jgi:hypothetical protein
MTTKEIVLRGHSGTPIPIKEFGLESFCANPSICMIAKRNSGKSWVCRAILKHFKYLPGGVIISPTENVNCFYGTFFPDLFIFDEYKPEILSNLFQRQEDMKDKCIKYYKKKKKCDPRLFLLMDDCLASKGTWMRDKQIIKMFFNGRHYQVMFILTMQFPLGITPELRGNFDYIFLLYDDFYTNQKRLFEHYAGMFPTFDFFRQVFMQLTEDYGCMVIANKGAKKNITDKVFYFKANNESIDKIGSEQFKNFHKYNYNKHHKETGKVFNINEYVPKTNKPNIAVKKIKHRSSDE